jgi:hypothetical protein
MKYHDNIIKFLAHHACLGISQKVVGTLRKITDGMQSGDNSGLKNIWDEICVQMQDEQSTMWDAYEDTICHIIEFELDKQLINVIEAIPTSLKQPMIIQTSVLRNS